MIKNKQKIILTGEGEFLSNYLKDIFEKYFDLIFLSNSSITKIIENQEIKKKFIDYNISKNIYAVVYIQENLDKYKFLYSPNLKKEIYFANVEVTKIFAEISIVLNIKKFIFFSTADIYGMGKLNQPSEFNTFSPLIPFDYYSASKLASEYALQSVFSKFTDRLIILRISEIIENNSSRFIKFMRFFIKNSLPFPVLNINNKKIPIRSFTNLDPLKKIILNLINKDIHRGEIVNISTSNHDIISLLEIFSQNNIPIKIFKLRINYFIANLFLKIPILKKIIYPLLLNHKVKSSFD